MWFKVGQALFLFNAHQRRCKKYVNDPKLQGRSIFRKNNVTNSTKDRWIGIREAENPIPKKATVSIVPLYDLEIYFKISGIVLNICFWQFGTCNMCISVQSQGKHGAFWPAVLHLI